MAGADMGKKKTDLGVRTLSALAMLAIAGGALWLGGNVWTALVLMVAAGVMWEWANLAAAFARCGWTRVAWLALGIVYIGMASWVIDYLGRSGGALAVLLLVGPVIATDIGAYFAGRTIGGPKIAPAISPSKTWAGLGGGVLGASLALLAIARSSYPMAEEEPLVNYLLAGATIAVVAQTGDFFESWMKRRAGVKDSGRLLPGHGGLFDRVDGLLAVSFAMGIVGAGIVLTAVLRGQSMLPTSA